MTTREPLILLTFDVEEFDVPLEHNNPIPLDEQLRVGQVGFERVLRVLDQAPGMPVATLFTTGVFAQASVDLMRQAAARHEIASHGYSHGDLKDGDLEKSKRVLSEITSQPITGFRRARMATTSTEPIARAGYQYNSSEHPTLLPGRYNNFGKPRRPYLVHHTGAPDLLNIPVSVTPILRAPMFWAAFKNFPMWFVERCAARTLGHDGVVNFYWHPWEFADIQSYGLPRAVRAIDGERLADRLAHFLRVLSSMGRFTTFSAYAELARARLAAGESP